jgi:hypothetical protein
LERHTIGKPLADVALAQSEKRAGGQLAHDAQTAKMTKWTYSHATSLSPFQYFVTGHRQAQASDQVIRQAAVLGTYNSPDAIQW